MIEPRFATAQHAWPATVTSVDTDDIAWAAVYLASDVARFTTRQVISFNGGWYMSR